MREVESSPQLRARIGGALYLTLIVLDILAEAARDKLIASANAAATAAKTAAKESLWRFGVTTVAGLLLAVTAQAATPKLNIKTAHGGPQEEARKQQIERLAQQYDLKKYTLTRDILVERGAMNHSYPVLTLNPRFLEDDDLALSAYVHEQAHWVLMERHRSDLPSLYAHLKRLAPDLVIEPPQGDGNERSSYFHLVVNMLEWQAMEDLVGPQRALRVIKWKQGDHYIAIYSAVLAHRDELETLMKQYGVKW